MRYFRAFSRNAALVALSSLVALVFLEGIVRLIEPREVMRYFFMQPDSLLNHSFIPGASGHYKTTEFDVVYRINSLGLRDREIAPIKPSGTRRLLLLGDSFTEGDGVEYEDSFSYRLQLLLDSTTLPARWEVINAGVGSYSPLLEYLYLVHHGLELQPDMVVLNLDLSDVFDDLSYAARTRYDGRGIPIAAAPETELRPAGVVAASLVDIKDFFKEHTRLYNFVRLRIDRYLEGARHTVDMSGNIRYDKYAMLRPQYRADFDRDCALTYRHLLLIRDTLHARGIGFRVNVYPYGLQVSPKEWAAGRQFWGFAPDTLYGTEPQANLARFCMRNGIPVTNLCDAFRAHARQSGPLYLDYNGHWMPAGHALVARELYSAILPELGEAR